jgi:SAM-dependent methyltransferase
VGLSYAEAQRGERLEGAGGVDPARDLFLHLGLFPEPAALERADLAALRGAQARLTELVLDAAGLGAARADTLGGAGARDVLELGAGLGGTLAALDRRLSGARLVGLDVDPGQVAFARAHVRPEGANALSFELGDACALPAPAASFDVVLAIECAFHFSSRARFVREAARVLRPGGRLVLTDLVASAELRRARDEGRSLDLVATLTRELGPWPDLWGDEGDYEALARAAGLTALCRRDLTLGTLPSYTCILGGKTAVPGRPDPDAGVAALAWLQLTGLVRTELWVLSR